MLVNEVAVRSESERADLRCHYPQVWGMENFLEGTRFHGHHVQAWRGQGKAISR